MSWQYPMRGNPQYAPGNPTQHPDPNAGYQQFQLQPRPAAPAAGVTVPPPQFGNAAGPGGGFSSPVVQNPFSAAGFTTATQPPPQQSQQPSPDNSMQMLLARAMSTHLASMLFQSFMGGGGTQQAPPQQPVPQPPQVFPPQVMMPNPTNPMMPSTSPNPSQASAQTLPLMQMMQALQAAVSAAQPQMSPPPQAMPPQAPPPQAATHNPPTPAASPATASSSPIQLPQMDPTVAKDMLLQLVQQLQASGQLPYDDTIQRLLQQPSPDLTAVQVVLVLCSTIRL